jgi:hypothetical protein
MSVILAIVFAVFTGSVRSAPQNVESEVRRAQSDIDRLEAAVRQLEDDTREIRNELERPFCTAQMESATGIRQFAAPSGPDAAVELALVSVVSDAPGCLPTVFTAIASYLDGQGNLICSGAIGGIARQAQGTGVVTMTVRPWNLREFIRWRNEPPRTNSGFQILFCRTPDGLTEASQSDLVGVESLRLRIVAQPGNGGLATEDFVISAP